MNLRLTFAGAIALATLSGCFFFTGAQPGATPAPSASGSAAPAPGSSAAPAPGAATPIPQKPYDFNSNTSGKGVIGTVRLELGKRTFKA